MGSGFLTVPMLVSVVIPTRHRNGLLADCLRCLAQGVQSLLADQYEIIVTDDGTASTARAMIDEQFPFVRWLEGPKRGPAANRNSGARAASGDYIVFTDDDCLPAANWLLAFISAIDSDIEVYEGRTTCAAGVHSPLQEAPENLTGGQLWSCNFMIRRSAFQQIGGFDESFPAAWCEDVDFSRRAKEAGLRRRFIGEAVVDHPPRRRAGALVEGRRWESRALLWFKEGNTTPLWKWMPRHVFQVRMHQTFKYRPQWDTVLSFFKVWVEWVYVLIHLPRWQQRYAPMHTSSSTS